LNDFVIELSFNFVFEVFKIAVLAASLNINRKTPQELKTSEALSFNFSF